MKASNLSKYHSSRIIIASFRTSLCIIKHLYSQNIVSLNTSKHQYINNTSKGIILLQYNVHYEGKTTTDVSCLVICNLKGCPKSETKQEKPGYYVTQAVVYLAMQ